MRHRLYGGVRERGREAPPTRFSNAYPQGGVTFARDLTIMSL